MREKWKGTADLSTVRYDTILSVAFWGLITMAILITASVAFEGVEHEVNNISDLSLQLRPILGNWSESFIATGFLAAGFTSSITAPLAAAFATSEILGWQGGLRDRKFRLIWGFVCCAGSFFFFGFSADVRYIICSSGQWPTFTHRRYFPIVDNE